ncbi:MAG: flagellar basal-body rod protein FlgF [Hyphomicrobiaceae bacterium]
METGLYVLVSGQLALQRRLDTIANNVANSSTSGFRAENVTFESILSNQSIAYSSRGGTTFSMASGGLTQTDNPLDMAIQGDAFFAIATPAGKVYTRDGRLSVSSTGELQTLNGHAVLDTSGAPLQVNPGQGSISVAPNGVLSQNGKPTGTIGLFKLPAGAQLQRGSGAGLVSDLPAEPVANFTENSIKQGYVEGANVNAVREMTRLVAVSRTFEAISSSLSESDRKLDESIRALGGSR